MKSGQSLQCTAQGNKQPRENRLTPSQEYLLATGNMSQRSGTADLQMPIPFQSESHYHKRLISPE